MLNPRQSRFLAAFTLTGLLVPLALAQGLDPVKQRDEQKKIKARVDEAARRASSTLDAMSYQRLSPSAERRLLEEVANGLRGLSDEEIRQVLQHLEEAIAAADTESATAAQREAVAKQRAVVEQLRTMIFKLDLIKSLDDAANRLDRAADVQLDLNAGTLSQAKLPRRPDRQILDESEDLALEQSDLRTELASIFQQVNRLLNDPVITQSLTPEQKDRITAADVLSRATRLLADMEQTARLLKSRAYEDAAERQRRHAKELKDLAAALRTPPASRVEALRAAAEKVARAIDAQTKVNNNTEEPTAAEVEKARASRQDPKLVKGNELANEQTKAEFATRDARRSVEQVAPEVAELLKPAENNQWKAEDLLRQGRLKEAKQPQDAALENLRAAKAELDRQLAAAEQARTDPLAAVRQAAEQIERLIQEQKDAIAKTEKAEAKPSRLPEARAAQREVAQGTEEVRKQPLPPNDTAKAALDKAAEAMRAANDKLDANNPTDAKPSQQQALKNLQEAKAALEQQAQNIEQRRQEIARLEELKNTLEELARNEQQIAREAQKAATDPAKPETGDLAAKQNELRDPTRQAEKQLQELANDAKTTDPMAAESLQKAAEKVAEAGKQQDAARDDLAMNRPMPGSDKAQDAAQKLREAAKEVQAQLDQKKGQEANDQAALQPNQVDPAAATEQIQKALEQTNTAAQKAQEANNAGMPPGDDPAMPKAGMMNDPGMNPPNNPGKMNDPGMNPEGAPNIAELQKEIAREAARQMLPDAAKAAEQAAQALERGNFPRAIENQQKALEELNRAAQQPRDMKGEQGMPPAGEKDMPPMTENGNPPAMPPAGEKGNNQPMGEKGTQGDMPPMRPREAEGMMGMTPTPADLARQQQQLLEATRALQQSLEANNAAQSAIQQAQANAPMAVQQQLQQAQQNLQQAQQNLQQARPDQAGRNQEQAAQALQQALDALNAAQKQQQQAMGMNQPMGMNDGMGMAQGMGMGMAQGMGMGMAQGMGMGMAQGQAAAMPDNMGMGMGNNAQQAMNQGIGEGDEAGGEKLKNTGSTGTAVAGDGSFIGLRKRERDKVTSGADNQFPAEFRELIKQYNMNIKNAKAATPAAGGR